jgi:hypothetical protein
VLNLPPAVRIWLATRATDLRKSFDTLAELVRQQLQADPLSGHHSGGRLEYAAQWHRPGKGAAVATLSAAGGDARVASPVDAARTF